MPGLQLQRQHVHDVPPDRKASRVKAFGQDVLVYAGTTFIFFLGVATLGALAVMQEGERERLERGEHPYGIDVGYANALFGLVHALRFLWRSPKLAPSALLFGLWHLIEALYLLFRPREIRGER